MPTTRRQAAAQQAGDLERKQAPRTRKTSTRKKETLRENAHDKAAAAGEKRDAEPQEAQDEELKKEEPPAKKAKTVDAEDFETNGEDGVKEESKGDVDLEAKQEQNSADTQAAKDHPAAHTYQTGTIERGHIYFFYRPKVELEEAHSIDDVQRFHILLIPRQPDLSTALSEQPAKTGEAKSEDQEMTLSSQGADAVPAHEPTNEEKKPFRLLVVGKKSLPDPEEGRGRNNIFWATTVTVGENLKKLEEGLGPKQYETKTRGTRHQGPARLAARGAYAVVNKEARIPSQRETHFGYHLSHPTPEHFEEIQEELGIHAASSFVLQVKNPLAPPTGPGRVGLPKNRAVDYPDDIMTEVFGRGGGRGREDFGLRFASVERKQMLDYEGVEQLFIAARSGDKGLEQSLGEGRGIALTEAEEKESQESIQQVFEELYMDSDKIPADPLEGMWA
ncbi:hypothetical protein IEO21_03084 [Rhodonia placenta]|uniref:Uncharacterized protein n=1 Tax=Rhodonia placenta TaxID=104341 RepID=A0A8H7U3V4_9APHY|nr:hypothetical protein IEO21_03084 [Postia placenta]